MSLVKFNETCRSSDDTISYDMIFLKDNIKLSELLIDLVYHQYSEWGTIRIYYPDPALANVPYLANSEKISSIYVTYKNHKVVDGLEEIRQLGIYDSIVNQKRKAYANGGWGMMDYIIYVV